MMSCVVLHGIILLVVSARPKQPKGLPRLCVRSVGRLRLPVFQSKIFTYSFVCKIYSKHLLLMSLCHRYLTKLTVYDNNDHASFVLLGDAGSDLIGKKASELVESYFEVITNFFIIQFLDCSYKCFNLYQANDSVKEDHVVPVPQALIGAIGQTRTFVIKVSKHNLDGKTQSLTVTKVLPPDVPALKGNIEENVDEEPTDERNEVAAGSVKRSSVGIESGETKRAKSG